MRPTVRLVIAATMLTFAVSCGGDGDAGAPGPSGSDGITGADGNNGTDGNNGADGTVGGDGTDGTDGSVGGDGTDGIDGTDGKSGGNVEVGDLHGTDYLLSTGDYADAGKFFATVTITGATIVGGVVTMDYTVEDDDANPIVGVTGQDFNVVQLQPASGGESFNKWVAYNYRTETVSGSTYPNPNGTTAEQPYRENSGTSTDNGDGSYTYVYAVDVTNVTGVTYDDTLTHRVSVMIGGHSGATGDAVFEFIPAGGTVTETRDIVRTEACMNCHGVEFHGHGGDRLSLDNCVTCHTQGNIDAQSGNDVDFKVMLHKIHAGHDMATIPGADGIVFDDPATSGDESADNGAYSIYGYNENEHSWWKVAFPAVIENCTKCHTGSGADVDNWKAVPSRDACGSCHDDIDFGTGTNHAGGVQANDNNCAGCHPATGGSNSVTEAHNWMAKIDQNIPEFDVDITVSAPSNTTHFVAGETPLVTLVIKENNVAIDHVTELAPGDTDEGCTTEPCGARDHRFDRAYLFVHGPRAMRGPVLGTAARADIAAIGAGPFDLTGGGSLSMLVDAGADIYSATNGGSKISGNITVDLGNGAATTGQNIVDTLNADTDFAPRAIAYMENGVATIRSRNLGKVFSLGLLAGNANTVVFGADVGIHTPGGYYPSNKLRSQDGDPKATIYSDRVEYSLDAVDDLADGTYIVSCEIADRGRNSGTDYKTPSFTMTTFQVGTATEEMPPARSCNSCHQNETGEGYVLDFARHYKVFGDLAPDQCASCHDQQPQNATGSGWSGGKPISRRVHGIHFGSSLNYPLATVDYGGGDPVKGRNWDITFPQDVRHCESCHPDGTTSGSWLTKAARLPCSGCHDADASMAHMKLMTYDPTPANPWSGDEEESCQACH